MYYSLYYAYEIVNQTGYLHLLSGPNDIKRTTKTSISSSNGKQFWAFLHISLPFTSHDHLVAFLHYLFWRNWNKSLYHDQNIIDMLNKFWALQNNTFLIIVGTDFASSFTIFLWMSPSRPSFHSDIVSYASSKYV